MQHLQERVADFIAENRLEVNPANRLLDLISEIGELSKEYLKTTDYGTKDFTPNESWSDELGDVCFALVCIANSTNIDLTVALDTALAKYRLRLETKGSSGSENEGVI